VIEAVGQFLFRHDGKSIGLVSLALMQADQLSSSIGNRCFAVLADARSTEPKLWGYAPSYPGKAQAIL
jgi:hypothetical protein